MASAIVLFAIIFVLNIIPAFAPPTWLVLSFIEINYPKETPLILALIGATAATLGRVVLARMSFLIIRQKWLSDGTRRNIDAVKERLEHRSVLTSSIFLFYAFSPLPSNYLFIAYGLTALELKHVALPFFVGRLISYGFWAFTASTAAHRFILESHDVASYLNAYFIVSQFLFLAIMYALAKLDWRALFGQKKFKWTSGSL